MLDRKKRGQEKRGGDMNGRFNLASVRRHGLPVSTEMGSRVQGEKVGLQEANGE